MAPETIKISAKLKTGQNFKSIKSMTQPHNTRSIALAKAPAKIRFIEMAV